MGFVLEGITLLAIPAVILAFDVTAYNLFVDVWNGLLDRLDKSLVEAINRVERW